MKKRSSPLKAIFWTFLIIAIGSALVYWISKQAPNLFGEKLSEVQFVFSVIGVATGFIASVIAIYEFFFGKKSTTIIQGDVVQGDKNTTFVEKVIIHQPGQPPVRLTLPPRPDPFRGRVDELAQLQSALQAGKIVTVCAAGGMGKTALSGEALWRLTESGTQPPSNFPDGVFFHTFYNQPSVEAALEELARFFGEEAKPTPEAAARRALSGKRALLILDGAEDADGLERVVNIHGGCGVLIATRDRGQIQGLEIELKPLGKRAALQLLKDSAGEYARPVNEARRICELVGYLPLALNLAGRYMCAHQQWAADYLVFLEKTPLAALHLDERSHQSAKVLFEHSLKALDEQAEQALQLLGLFGRLAYAPLAESWLGVVFPDQAALRRGLDGLTRYGLLNAAGGGRQLAHALLHTYARECPPPEGGLRTLALRWRSYVKEQTALGAEGFERLDPLRPHLRAALERLSAAGEWHVFFALAYPVQDYFDLHGYTSERRGLCELARQVAQQSGERQLQGDWLNSLGNAYSSLGETAKAIEVYEQARVIHQELQDPRGEGADLGNLGIAHKNLGEISKAIEYYQQVLAIARRIGNVRMEGNALGNLGNAYYALGETKKAIEYHEQALAISRQIGDVRGEGVDLGNLGSAYADLGETAKAIEYHEKALAVARQIGDRGGEGNALGNLGNAYYALGETKKAIEVYEQALAIARRIGDVRAEGIWLGCLGNACSDLGETTKAIEYHEQALAISRRIGDVRNEGNHLNNLGAVFADVGEYARATEYYQQALAIFEPMLPPEHPFIQKARRNIERARAKLGGG